MPALLLLSGKEVVNASTQECVHSKYNVKKKIVDFIAFTQECTHSKYEVKMDNAYFISR